MANHVTSVYEDLSDDISLAVSNAGGSISPQAVCGHTWMDSDPPALILHFYPDQAQWLRQEITRRVVENLASLNLVAESPGADDSEHADDLLGRMVTGGWVAVRRASP